jgi:iron complex outermembrane receptor protein
MNRRSTTISLFAPGRAALALAALVAIATLAALAPPATAQSISGTTIRTLYGHVRDARTSQPVPGAHVRSITNPAWQTSAASDGTFRLADLPATVQELEASRIGYGLQRIHVDLADSAAVAEFSLEPRAIPEPPVEVTTTRATERGSAVAFTELDRPKIKERYWAQDVPMLLAETPGVYAYSDAGNGVGYSYVKVRGFPQRRVAVTINGIPLNDPESHEVYWVDHPDLLASAATLQVQRGVGSALYGASAAGGSINLETLRGPGERRITVEAGGGTYDTQRGSVQYESGLLDDTYALTGRFSRIRSQGYREQSWVDLWSYAFSASRFDSWITTRLNLYGGPERLHLAYFAADRSYLDGRITGDADQDRRFNPLTWRNETDNFFEPHQELIQDVKLGANSALTSALFYFPGKGYYDDLPYGPQDFASHHLPDFTVTSNTQYPAAYYADTTGPGPYTVVATDMTQRLWVRNAHYGWAPRARFGHSRGELTVGGEWREHTGRHWGELTWGAALPPGTPPNFVFYDYTGRVNVMSSFAQEAYDLRPNLRLTGSLEWRRTRYAIGKDRFNGYDFDLHYTPHVGGPSLNLPLSPRVGVNWNATDRWNLFGSFAATQIEPILSEIYRPDDPTSVPLFRVLDPANHIYEDPLIDPETLNDYEAGWGFRSGESHLRLTGFWLDFQNEIVPSGQVDQFGVPITGNAARSAHKGLELEWSGRHKSGLELSGNLTMSRNRYKSYLEFVDSTTVNDYSGNAIAGFPDRLANVTLGYRRGWGRVSASVVEVGRQYLDNTEDNRKDPALRAAPGYQHKYIEEHAILNGLLSLDLNTLTGSRPLDAQTLAIDVHLLNLTGLKYETSGYVFEEIPYFYPASTRSVFVSLRTEF